MADRVHDAARALLPMWQQRLRVADWRIVVADAEPDGHDERSSVDVAVVIRSAVIRLRSDTPASEIERQLVHELLHVRFAEVEDVFHLAQEHTPPAFDKVADRSWDRGMEAAIEALTDVLTGSLRADWCSGSPWDAAFSPRGGA